MLLSFLLLAVFSPGHRIFHGVSELPGCLGITPYHSLSDARSLSPVSPSTLHMALSLFGMYSAFPGILEERNKDAPTRAWIQNLQSSEASLIFYLKSPDAQKHQETGLPPCHPADLGLGPSEEDREGNGNPLQYSSLENPLGRGARQASVHGVAKSRT